MTEFKKIQLLLNNNDLEYVNQGLVLLETLCPKYPQLIEALQKMARQNTLDIKEIIDTAKEKPLHFLDGRYRKYISSWLYCQLASFPETKDFYQNHTKLTIYLSYQQNDIPDNIGNLHFLKSLTIIDQRWRKNLIIPESIGELHHLEHFSAPKCEIQELPQSFNNLKKLKHLNLKGNQLPSLPFTEAFPHLETLNLSHNQLTALPNIFCASPNLRTVNVQHNQLTMLPGDWSLLKQLQTFNFQGNLLQHLPEGLPHIDITMEQWFSLKMDIARSSVLKSIKIVLMKWDNKIHSTEKFQELGKDPKVIELVILNQPLKNTDFLQYLTHLQKVTLLNCSLNEFPESLCALPHLKEINLSRNAIQQIPDSIGQLVNLEHLYLNRQKYCWKPTFTSLPETIGQLHKLKRLNLTDHPIQVLPSSIGNCTALEYLKLHRHSLTELPESFANLTNLKYLWLSNGKLERLPQGMGQLQNLEIFTLNYNNLTELPDSISKLSQFKEWNLNNNALQRLPDTFVELNPVKLHLNHNQIKSLPKNFTQLHNLEELHIYQNSLTHLPDLSNASQLNVLQVHQNALNTLPEWLCNHPNRPTVTWQRNRLQHVPKNWSPDLNPNITVDFNRLFFKTTSNWGMHKEQKSRQWIWNPFNRWLEAGNEFHREHIKDEDMASFVNEFLAPYHSSQMRYLRKIDGWRRPYQNNGGQYITGNWYARKRRYGRRRVAASDPNLTSMQDLFNYRSTQKRKLRHADLIQGVRDQMALEFGSRVIPFTQSLVQKLVSIIFFDLIPSSMTPLLRYQHPQSIRIQKFGSFTGYMGQNRRMFDLQKGEGTMTVEGRPKMAFRMLGDWSQARNWQMYENVHEQLDPDFQFNHTLRLSVLQNIVYWALTYNGYQLYDCVNMSNELVQKIFTLIFDPTVGIIPNFLQANREHRVHIKGWGKLYWKEDQKSIHFHLSRSLSCK